MPLSLLQRKTLFPAIPAPALSPAADRLFSVTSGPDGEFQVAYPGIVTFHFQSDGAEVTSVAAPGVGEDFVRELFARELTPLIMQLRGREVLHASAVTTPRGVLAFCGESGAGKSTMAHVFGLHGCPVVADDAVVVDCAVPPRIAPQPFCLRLRPDAAAFLPADPRHVASVLKLSESLPLRAFVMLDRDEHATAINVSRLTAVESFRKLLSHAYCLSLQDLDRKRRMVENYLDLAQHVPVFKAVFAPDLQKVAELAVQIDTKLRGLP